MKTKKYFLLRWLLMAAAVMFLLLGLVKLCNYLLTDDSQSYTRLTMHELYERADAGEEVDTLFLGSSHCYRAYDPALYEELTGETAYNLGSSSQNYDTSYYLLREAARLYDLKTVYLDMHYKFLFMDSEDRDLVQANIISDYMRPSRNKLSFLLTTTEAKNYTNRLLSLPAQLAAAWRSGLSEEKSGEKADRRLPQLRAGDGGSGSVRRPGLRVVGCQAGCGGHYLVGQFRKSGR